MEHFYDTLMILKLKNSSLFPNPYFSFISKLYKTNIWHDLCYYGASNFFYCFISIYPSIHLSIHPSIHPSILTLNIFFHNMTTSKQIMILIRPNIKCAVTSAKRDYKQVSTCMLKLHKCTHFNLLSLVVFLFFNSMCTLTFSWWKPLE